MAAGSSSVSFYGSSSFRSEQENQNNQILLQQQQQQQQQPNSSTTFTTATTTTTSSIASTTAPPKKRRNQSASSKKKENPNFKNSDAEVVALSPKTLMATNRFICEVCNKGFQREQNLQLHRRGHNLPWKLKQKNNKDPPKRKVFLCPEPSCVHHDPSRALGDLTGIKKHYSRKHGEKKWKCEKCSKRYAVQSDWKAHSKTCGTREYRCECGTLFSRRDSLITHRAFCDALAQETARHPTSLNSIGGHQLYGNSHVNLGLSQMGSQFSSLQNHPSANNMLRLGHNITTPKIENLISLSSSNPNNNNNNSFGNPTQNYSPSTFFLQDHHHNNQAYHPFLNKPSHSLTQLPDLQSNNNNNNNSSDIFNLGFFSNNNGNIRSDQFNLDHGGGNNTNGMPTMFSSIADHMAAGHGGAAMSSLYGGGGNRQDNSNNNNNNNNSLSPHMSATALLQKAAQIDSTTSKIVRNMHGGGISSNGNNNTITASLDAQLKSTQQSQLFGGTTSTLH
ncbi:hypothetical protein F8388_001201 [Cannabis sativa]|uniref:C2H2-type domain-containing protein n=1 Tax=Cannabis sativa TaxID=3483 RepID=A0A7J6ESA8_CANSA|nr:hypothetical protein F8388_001201 [Cannabis sativa]